jgi:hypothetical protein
MQFGSVCKTLPIDTFRNLSLTPDSGGQERGHSAAKVANGHDLRENVDQSLAQAAPPGAAAPTAN